MKKKREQGRAKNKGKKKGTAADIHKATLMVRKVYIVWKFKLL